VGALAGGETEASHNVAMKPLLYDELVPWYYLLDPTEDHLDEAAGYQAAFERAIEPRAETLLELGAGGGNNACFLKRRFRCTLTDISAPMLGLSRKLNPDCEHALGDMRTLRLGRAFDAVLVHDAVMYLTSESDLRAAAETAFAHTRPGGAAIFAPDCVRESFGEISRIHRGDDEDGGRALRCMEWTWDPDPKDTSYTVEYAFLLRDRSGVRAVHDRHIEGLFPRATWVDVLTTAGFEVETTPRDGEEEDVSELFLCRRP
jgi:SAM-dependent methyltransferase